MPGKATRSKASSKKKSAKSKTKKLTRSKPSVRRASKPRALNKLHGEEARELLEILVGRHPELSFECEQLAREIVDRVDPEKLARKLHRQLMALDMDDLSARSGRHMWGYVEPADAAQELLDALMESYLVDLRRQIELGLEVAARSHCLGIVLGLYRARGVETDSPLAYAPDYCENEAAYAVEILAKQSSKMFRRRWRLPDGCESRLAEWGWLFRRSRR
ncbi:MAG: hypothetical protein ACE5FA_03655 [Dehalococcoidia bacterium]